MAALSTPKNQAHPNMFTTDTEDNRALLQAESGLLSELARESVGQQAQAVVDKQCSDLDYSYMPSASEPPPEMPNLTKVRQLRIQLPSLMCSVVLGALFLLKHF
jgi:hypothetical protein